MKLNENKMKKLSKCDNLNKIKSLPTIATAAVQVFIKITPTFWI
jgi:hypothetical protein